MACENDGLKNVIFFSLDISVAKKQHNSPENKNQLSKSKKLSKIQAMLLKIFISLFEL